MTADISPTLRRYLAAREYWSAKYTFRKAEALAQEHHLIVSWDSWSGEEWITLTDALNRTICHLRVDGPLALSVKPLRDDVWQTVVVTDMDSPELSADTGLLLEAFSQDLLASGELDPGKFSASDLWFETV